MKVVLSGKLHQVHIGREDEGGDRQKTEESPGKTPTETGGSQAGEKCLCLALRWREQFQYGGGG